MIFQYVTLVCLNTSVLNFIIKQIDFVCARLNVPRVNPDINLKDSSILQGLDDRCIRSINGTRVADDIIRLVPNVKTFRIALRCIKLWAMKKAVYSNVMGFLGGVAWAILVARICQLYPNACASVIISKFFRILTKWNWPSPVILKPIEDGPPLSSSLRPWNAKSNAIDRTHRMPVITPSYPSMCATHNVTASTQRIILGEFNIAAQTVDKIMANHLPWSALFQPHTFFHNYKYYLQVVVSGDTHDRYLSWSGLVEAKLRQLVIKLEAVPVIALVHPFVEGFKYEYKCYNAQDIYDATHGQIISMNKSNKKKPVKVFTKVFYIGLYIRMRTDHPRTLDLTRPIYDFTHMLKCWPEFNRDHMGIVVENVRRSDLPEEVYPKKDASLSKRALSKVNTSKMLTIFRYCIIGLGIILLKNASFPFFFFSHHHQYYNQLPLNHHLPTLTKK
jgi:poly(A) polymerase